MTEIEEAKTALVLAINSTSISDGHTITLQAIAWALIAIAESLERSESRPFESSRQGQ